MPTTAAGNLLWILYVAVVHLLRDDGLLLFLFLVELERRQSRRRRNTAAGETEHLMITIHLGPRLEEKEMERKPQSKMEKTGGEGKGVLAAAAKGSEAGLLI
jgi:hypothetical protein